MERVREQYAELKAVMEGFEVSMSHCLANAEEEFLRAYRAHMVEVHREMHELRNKLMDAQASAQNDEQIRSLEKEVAWYRDRAAELTAQLAIMEKDKAYLTERLQITNEDRKWLRQQVKAMKREVMLRQATDAEERAKQLEAEEAVPPPVRKDDWLKTRLSGEREAGEESLEAQLRRLRRECMAAKKGEAVLRRMLVVERQDVNSLEDMYWKYVETAKKDWEKSHQKEQIDFSWLVKLGKMMFPPKHKRKQRILDPIVALDNRSLCRSRSTGLSAIATKLAPAAPLVDNQLGLNDFTIRFLKGELNPRKRENFLGLSSHPVVHEEEVSVNLRSLRTRPSTAKSA